MNIRKTITSEIEWNTIKKAQADGKLQELLQVGDELDITLKTGEELTVQAVGTTERGLIFLLKDCMKDEHGMNKRMTNKGGWRDSEMRLWLNETIIHMLPDELREMIVPRRASCRPWTENDWRARTSCGCRRSQRCSARKERRTGHWRTQMRHSWSCSARSAAT